MLLLKAGFVMNGHKMKFIKEITEAAYGKWTSNSCRIIDFFIFGYCTMFIHFLHPEQIRCCSFLRSVQTKEVPVDNNWVL
jgi:hypothetical protein